MMNIPINDEGDYRKYLDKFYPEASDRDKEITLRAYRTMERFGPEWPKKLEREFNKL